MSLSSGIRALNYIPSLTTLNQSTREALRDQGLCIVRMQTFEVFDMDQVVADLRERIQDRFSTARSVFAGFGRCKGRILVHFGASPLSVPESGRLAPPPQSAPQNLKWNLRARRIKAFFLGAARAQAVRNCSFLAFDVEILCYTASVPLLALVRVRHSEATSTRLTFYEKRLFLAPDSK